MVAAGKYDLMNESEIAPESFFATAKKGKVDVKLYLVHFDLMLTDEEAISKLDRLGFLPAKNEQLLAFGEKYPTKQLDYPIVALGSVWTDPIGRHYVTYLDRSESDQRYLYLFTRIKISEKWLEHCRFLAVQK